MDKAQVLHLFWNSFGVPAIDENSAYDTKVLKEHNIGFPRITYEVAESNLGDPVMLAANIWYRNISWQGVETKAKQIAAFIGYGGKTFPVDGGYMRIMLPQGTTIFRRMSDPDDSLRRIVFNISVDYLTAT